MIEAGTRSVALRSLCHGLLLVWLCKWDFFARAARIYLARPLEDAFFPAPLQSFWLLAAAFCVPPVLCFGALLVRSLRGLSATLGAFAVSSIVLVGHQGSYNDATFVTSFWVSLSGVWLAHASRRSDRALAQRVAFIAQLIVGLQFLGGAVGKLTPGYLDGSVLYEIYFARRDHPTFALLRGQLDPAQLHEVARVYSRCVVALEWALASLPLWPARPALWWALAALSGLVLFNNLRLFSVVGSLIALVAVALWLNTRALPVDPPAYAVS